MPETLKTIIDSYLPITAKNDNTNTLLPFITLTFAQSLDSRISLGKGIQTKLSHLQTKSMTHYLRYHHDAILIGINTFLTDNPSLNCRFNPTETHLIRPIIIDPHMKCLLNNTYINSKLATLAKSQNGLAPFIITKTSTFTEKKKEIDEFIDSVNLIESNHLDLKVIPIDLDKNSGWKSVFTSLKQNYNINSIMIEGGAFVINDLLSFYFYLIDSLIITIAPVYLGENAIQVSPIKPLTLLNDQSNGSKNLTWWTGIQDSVLMFKKENE